MKQIEASDAAVKREFTELNKKRTVFEEQIRDELSGKGTIIQLKE